MPIYEYKCDFCNFKFELLRKISDAPIKKCPMCQQNKIVKLISKGLGWVLKGKGFHCNDYSRRI